MILVIDNYDSFTYNLVHLVAGSGAEVRVIRNDEWTWEAVANAQPKGILVSPGPGRPADAGITEEVIRRLGPTIPILGVCLGHQAIGEVFGGRVVHAPSLMHGKTSPIRHDGRSVFRGVPQEFVATRYHSLVVDRWTFPEALEVSAETPDGIVMGLRHRAFPIEGIQFHPESLLTTAGPALVANWIESLAVPSRA